MENAKVPAQTTIDILIKNPESLAFIDVRSEGEWDKANSPGFINLPVLNNQERHEVGLCYKKKGQREAIQLAEQLVQPYEESRFQSWSQEARGREVIVCCWRGGMRSQRVADFLNSRGIPAKTVQGGYKALRQIYLEILETNLPEFLILSGLTGVDKTGLLKACKVPKIDLEGLAHHRGSAFGGMAQKPQPGQATFENQLAFQLLGQKGEPVLLEDESVHIGRVRLPPAVRLKMTQSPNIVLDVGLKKRVENIVREYILEPLDKGYELSDLLKEALFNLERIQNRLGGKLKKEIEEAMQLAFSKTPNSDNHFEWIAMLLDSYYDPMYRYGLERKPKSIVFKGDFETCRKWIETQLPSV